MKKFIKSIVSVGLVLLVTTSMVKATTLSLTVNAGTMTNLLVNFNNPIFVTSMAVTAPTGQGGILSVYDTPTNSTVYTTLAYSNTVSYATNEAVAWTNYYGIVSTGYTSIYLIDVTNTIVPAATYNYPCRLVAAVTNGVTQTFYNFNAPFNNGIWVTNAGVGSVTITFNY